MSWLGGLKPLGTTAYVSPIEADKTNTTNTISGHRNWAATDCPGDRFYPTLDRSGSKVALAVPLVPPGVSVWPRSFCRGCPTRPLRWIGRSSHFGGFAEVKGLVGGRAGSG